MDFHPNPLGLGRVSVCQVCGHEVSSREFPQANGPAGIQGWMDAMSINLEILLMAADRMGNTMAWEAKGTAPYWLCELGQVRQPQSQNISTSKNHGVATRTRPS
ncbi:uncharacterized protein PS065_021005 [Dugong dugon]